MENKELLEELYKIGKLPSEMDCPDNFPLDKFDELIKQIQLPLDIETIIKLINLSPPTGTGCFGVHWSLVHLIEKCNDNFEDFKIIMDKSEEGEVKNLLKIRMENYLENNKTKELF